MSLELTEFMMLNDMKLKKNIASTNEGKYLFSLF